MKRSTILLITLLVVVIVAPIIYITTVVNKLPSFKDWIVDTIDTLDADRASLYEYKMTVTASQTLPDCYMYVTTYSGAVDSLHSVNFVAPLKGVHAELTGDSIAVNLDSLHVAESDRLLLTIELPAGSTLKIDNQQAAVDIHFNHGDLGAVNAATHGDLFFDNSDLGALMTVENDSPKSVSIKYSDIGAVKVNGNRTTLTVADSNVGAMSVAGTCDAIALDDSNIGVVSWNDECNGKAVVTDCAMTVKVKENNFVLTEDDGEENDSLVKMYIVDEDGAKVNVSIDDLHVSGADGERVDITPTEMHVQGEDGEKVDISSSGIHVEDGETTVKITPSGIVVKENGEEVVNVGFGGIKVK